MRSVFLADSYRGGGSGSSRCLPLPPHLADRSPACEAPKQ